MYIFFIVFKFGGEIVVKEVSKRDLKIINDKVCFSTSFMARLLHVSSQTVNNWEKQGCPKEAHGYWCLYDIIEWRESKHREKVKEKDVEKMDLLDQKVYYEIQQKRANTELQELKANILNGDYLEKKVAVDELKRFLVVFKRAAYSMGKKVVTQVAPYVDNAEARKLDSMVTDTINDVLSQMSAGDLGG